MTNICPSCANDKNYVFENGTPWRCLECGQSGNAIETLSRDLVNPQMGFLLSTVSDQNWDPPWTAESFLKDLPSKWTLSFTHSEGGVAIVSQPIFDRIHLHLLAVAPAHRNKGIGTQMMRELLSRAGNRAITLRVPRENESAMRFYRRHGFQFEAQYLPMHRAAMIGRLAA